MNILVIKQTSLGDVLHSTGHIRAIKKQYPHCHLTLLTATTSAEIFRNNPYVDRIVEFERYAVKEKWISDPAWTLSHFKGTLSSVRDRHYDVAIDLQGRWKSVLFLYAVNATRKYVKGRWVGLKRFRNRSLHALSEMDHVLKLANIDTSDTSMQFFSASGVREQVEARLVAEGYTGQPLILISPFTRWESKNWSLQHYQNLIERFPPHILPVITGARSDVRKLKSLLVACKHKNLINLCGEFGLQEFAELVRKSAVVVSGDSFAMHLAVACDTPVIALFGPTDENKVGPGNKTDKVLRGGTACRRCYKRLCERRCIDDISVNQVFKEIETRLASPEVS